MSDTNTGLKLEVISVEGLNYSTRLLEALNIHMCIVYMKVLCFLGRSIEGHETKESQVR